MSHRRRNGKYRWRKKKANHGKMGACSFEKGDFCRDFRRKCKILRTARVVHKVGPRLA